jgi:carboxylesterase
MPFQPTYEVPAERQAYTIGPNRKARVGVLVLHGFMGSPISSRPMAEYLVEQLGVVVHCPLLPGHGHYPDKLYGVSRKEWVAEAEEAYQFIRPQVERLFLIGHSMGNVLGATIATRHDDAVGMAMLAPVYHMPDRRLRITPYARYVLPWYYPHKSKRESMQHLVRERCLDFDPSIDFESSEFQARLPEVTRVPIGGMAEMVRLVNSGHSLWPKLEIPVRMFAGAEDDAAPPENAELILEALPDSDKELTIYPEAGHELMRPFEPVHADVWSRIARFIQERST